VDIKDLKTKREEEEKKNKIQNPTPVKSKQAGDYSFN
jgi:hypothetical protein